MYVDPGAGSLAFQLIVSAAVGALYTFRRAIGTIAGALGFRRRQPTGNQDADADTEQRS